MGKRGKFSDEEVIKSLHEDRLISITEYGAHSKKKNIQNELQSAINDLVLTGGKIYFPPGLWQWDTVSLYPNIEFFGAGRELTTLKKIEVSEGATDNHFMYGIDVSNLTFRDLTFQQQEVFTSTSNSALIRLQSFTEANKQNKNISFYDCKFVDKGVGRQTLVHIRGYMHNIRVYRNRFENYANMGSANKTASFHLTNDGYINDSDSYVWFNDNEIIGGKEGLKVDGVGYPPNLFVSGNLFEGLKERALQLYRGQRYIVANNRFENCESVPTTVDDGSVVWLDTGYATEKLSMFVNNEIFNSVGNAILLEEFKGIISGNEIRNVAKRVGQTFTKSYTYNSTTSSHSSDGGNGIQVTGGCEGTIIEGNKITGCANSAIQLDRAIGIQQTYLIGDVTIRNNTLEATTYCIEANEKIGNLVVMSNEIKSAGHGIIIKRINTEANNVFVRLKMMNNFVEANICIEKQYSGNIRNLVNNILKYTTSAVVWTSPSGFSANNQAVSGDTVTSTI